MVNAQPARHRHRHIPRGAGHGLRDRPFPGAVQEAEPGVKAREVVFGAPSAHPCQNLDPSVHHSLTAQELLDNFGSNPFILQLPGSCIRYLIDAFFEKQNFKPILACSTNHAQSICEMVSSNVGGGFIPTGYAVDSPTSPTSRWSPRCTNPLGPVPQGPDHGTAAQIFDRAGVKMWRKLEGL